jgi:hypothetical protein
MNKLIDTIKNSQINSSLSPELEEFRNKFNNSYEPYYLINQNIPIIKTYASIYKFFINQEIQEKKTINHEFSDKNKYIDLDKYQYRYYSKNINDVFTTMFFDIFANLSLMTSIERNLWIKNIKFEILHDFTNNDLFKKYSYTEFKKSDLDDLFGMNKPILITYARIYADVFNINFVTISINGDIKYMNICNPNRATWLLVENPNGWYNISNKKNVDELFLRYENIPEIHEDLKKSSKLTISNTLDIIQNYSKGLGIDPKKDGKTTKKNKTKEELINEIKQIYKE